MCARPLCVCVCVYVCFVSDDLGCGGRCKDGQETFFYFIFIFLCCFLCQMMGGAAAVAKMGVAGALKGPMGKFFGKMGKVCLLHVCVCVCVCVCACVCVLFLYIA